MQAAQLVQWNIAWNIIFYLQGDIYHKTATAESRPEFHGQRGARIHVHFHPHDAWTPEHLITQHTG